MRSLRYLKPSAEFRKQWQYCNFNYLVLARIVQALTGIPFEDFVKNRLFSPIGMSTATYDTLGAESSGKRVEPYFRAARDLVRCLNKVSDADAERLTGPELFDRMRLSECLGVNVSIGPYPSGAQAGVAGVICSPLDLVSSQSLLIRAYRTKGDPLCIRHY